MSAPFVPALDTFAGGQMTDLPKFMSPTLDGTELFEIVSGFPLATTPETAVNYSITSLQLAIAIASLSAVQVVIGQGENTTSDDPLIVGANVGRIYVNKPTPEPTFIQFDNASGYVFDVLVKDVAGTANASGDGITNLVTVDGVTDPEITVPFGGFWFRPVTSLNIWTLGTA